MTHEISETVAQSTEVAAITPPRSRNRRWLLPALTGLAGFLLGAATVAGAITISGTIDSNRAASAAEVAQAARAGILPAAVKKCGLEGNDGAELGDAGYSLTVNHRGAEDFTGINTTDLDCLTSALETPTAVKSHMQQTTSMDGRQTETWNHITASWSYHPDRGEDSIFTVEK